MRLNRHLLLRLAALAAIVISGCAVTMAATPKKKAAAKKPAAARIPAIISPVGGGYYEIPSITLPASGSSLPDFDKLDKKRIIDAYGNPVSPWSSEYQAFFWNEPNQCLIGYTDDYVYYLNPDLTVIRKESYDRYNERSNKGYNPATGKTAIVNDKGEVTGEAVYDLLGEFSEGYAAAVKGDKSGIVDMNGNVVVPFIYDYAECWGDSDSDPLPMHVHQGLCAAGLNDMWGVIDMKGNVVVPFEYGWTEVGSKGTIRAYADGRNIYFDKTGRKLRSDRYNVGGDDPDADFIPIEVTTARGDKFGYMGPDGTILIEPQFDMALPFAGPTALVKKGGAWHLIDSSGKIVKRNVAKWMIGELAG